MPDEQTEGMPAESAAPPGEPSLLPSFFHKARIERDILLGHNRAGKFLLCLRPALGAVNFSEPFHAGDALRHIVDEKTMSPMLDDLWQSPARTGDNRRPASQRLGENNPKRLVPLDRHNHRRSAAEERALLPVANRAGIFNPIPPKIRRNLALPIGRPFTLGHSITGDDEASTSSTRNGNCGVRPLDSLNTAEENQWRVRSYGWNERVLSCISEIRNDEPLAAPLPALAGDVLTACCKGKRPAAEFRRKTIARPSCVSLI